MKAIVPICSILSLTTSPQSRRRKPQTHWETLENCRAPQQFTGKPPLMETFTFFFVLFLLGLAISDPDDQACLSSLKQNFQDPKGRLAHWTQKALAFPCNGVTTSSLEGVTCNNDTS
ncbi:hypothetical protein AMTR_s00058p00085020 [Amborella trichopoda]|uniref:Leucine-rich repeat-containing N-terminal plant-type domain-containing protein n=1 Tax=Amborella trichopoda TaxID=13333 RepID=W1PEW6_AMBTC|nr:hypothetical protein AMTR_s00058p00085020 [Amborella trichopoda]